MQRIWGADAAEAAGKGFPDCARCRDPRAAEMRTTWGCDDAAARPVFDIGCNRCLGGDPECELCGGINRVPQRRCPTALMTEATPLDRMSVDLLMRSYIQLDSRSVLPVAGGFLDQTRGFAAACEIIDSERGRIEKIKADAREREQRASQARNKQGRR